MRCANALERMAMLTDPGRLASDAPLSAHLEGCGACAREWRRHVALLGELGDPAPLPDFGDMAPAVLARLASRRVGRPAYWQWAAAAAVALAALALGFLFGSVGTGPAPAPDTMAATYQEAFTTLPSSTAEVAYLENGVRPAAVGSKP